MDLTLNNLQRLIFHETQTTNQSGSSNNKSAARPNYIFFFHSSLVTDYCVYAQAYVCVLVRVNLQAEV